MAYYLYNSSNTKNSDKMAHSNSAKPDQTAPEVWTVYHSTKYFMKQEHKRQKWKFKPEKCGIVCVKF